LYRLAPGVLDALKIVRPETVIRWHRAGFRAYWRWKSRPRGGRPKTPLEIRQLIREISLANSLWGAPRIHGELLKLGIDAEEVERLQLGEAREILVPTATMAGVVRTGNSWASLFNREKLELAAIAHRALRHTFVFGPGFKRHSHFFGAHESPTDISIFRTGIERN
jgi:hypothetical protein